MCFEIQLEALSNQVKQEINHLLTNSPLWKTKDNLFQSVNGVGPVLSRTLLAELPERVEATILATDPRVLGHLERRRPDATAVLLPQIRSRWDFRSIARHARAIGAAASPLSER